MEVQMKFERFDDLFCYICREWNRLENHGEESDEDDDEDYNEDFHKWVEECLTAETRELILNGEFAGLSPSVYAEVLDDSYLYCQVYPEAEMDAVFRQRMGMRVQMEMIAKTKGFL